MTQAYQEALAIVRVLREKGHTAFFAGGWVRDFLLQVPSDDIDIATSARPEEIQTLFPQTHPVGVAFGVILVVQKGFPFEVATFRSDGLYSEGRRPESIHYSDPEEDALRRDFTINGMFYDPTEHEVIDYVGGRADLAEGVIRAIGVPEERFREDRLRMLRAVRFAARLEYKIDAETQKAIRQYADQLFPAVSVERVWYELQRMAVEGPRFLRALDWMEKLGLFTSVFPGKETFDEDDRRALRWLMPKSPLMGLLCVLYRNCPESLSFLCERYKVSKKERLWTEQYCAVATLSDDEEPYIWTRFYAKEEASFLLRASLAGREERDRLWEEHQIRRQQLTRHVERVQNKNALVKAQDLLALGIPRGPRLGVLLKEAERFSVNEDLHEKEPVLQHIALLYNSSP